MGWPQSVALKPELELGRLLEGTRLHTGLAAAVLLAGALWVVFSRTVFGFDLRAQGANARAAAFAGVRPLRTVALLMGDGDDARCCRKRPGAAQFDLLDRKKCHKVRVLIRPRSRKPLAPPGWVRHLCATGIADGTDGRSTLPAGAL